MQVNVQPPLLEEPLFPGLEPVAVVEEGVLESCLADDLDGPVPLGHPGCPGLGAHRDVVLALE